MPKGGITHPHIDLWGSSGISRHLMGRKLWLFWPPTEHNLKVYQKLFDDGDFELRMNVALNELEALSVYYADGKSAQKHLLHFGPGVIHAVLTFELSSHTSASLWDIDAWPCSSKIIDLHLTVGEQDANTQTNIVAEQMKEFCTEVEWFELKRWVEVANCNPNHPNAAKITEFVFKAQARLEVIRKARLDVGELRRLQEGLQVISNVGYETSGDEMERVLNKQDGRMCSNTRRRKHPGDESEAVAPSKKRK